MALAKKQQPRATLVTTPAYPIPGRPFRLQAFPEDNTTGTHARIWCLAAPVGTKLRKQLDETRASRVVFQALMPLSTSARPFGVDVTLEKGGGYVLQVDELQVGAGFTGGYESDPRGAPSETIRSVGVVTLYVSSPLTMQLGCGGDTATLKLYVNDETVIQTDLPVHGETTPRLDISPTATPRARLASEATEVRSAVASLAGLTVSNLVGDVAGSLDNLLTRVRAHMVQSGRHYADDTDNTIADSFDGATTAPSRAAALAELRRLLGRHMRNDSGAGTGSASVAATNYHSAADWPNLTLDTAAPNDALTDGIAHADAWRAFEMHRKSQVHKKTDGINAALPLPPLLDLHRQFLVALAASTIATPDTSQSGTALLISQLGFKDA